ncbi:hypothetical protein [Pseudomonas sp. DWR1-3-2b2]
MVTLKLSSTVARRTGVRLTAPLMCKGRSWGPSVSELIVASLLTICGFS